MKYALMSYGISNKALPLDTEGRLLYVLFEQFIKQRRIVESNRKAALASLNIIVCPSKYDVLLGRGKPYQEFTGNVHLNQLVELRRKAYNETSRLEKTRTMKEIVESIHQLGGRFLKRCPCCDKGKNNTTTTTTTSASSSSFARGQSSSVSSSCPLFAESTNVNFQSSSSSSVSLSSLSSSATSSPFTPLSTNFSAWEVVEDVTVAHRKVSNSFQTRNRIER